MQQPCDSQPYDTLAESLSKCACGMALPEPGLSEVFQALMGIPRFYAPFEIRFNLFGGVDIEEVQDRYLLN